MKVEGCVGVLYQHTEHWNFVGHDIIYAYCICLHYISKKIVTPEMNISSWYICRA